MFVALLKKILKKIFFSIIIVIVIILYLKISSSKTKFDTYLNFQLNFYDSDWKDDELIQDQDKNQENYNDLNLKNAYCKKPDLSFADAIAKKYMEIEKRWDECKDIENFVALIENEVYEEFQMKLNISIILREYNINENELLCQLKVFDKIYNITDNNLKYINETIYYKIHLNT